MKNGWRVLLIAHVVTRSSAIMPMALLLLVAEKFQSPGCLLAIVMRQRLIPFTFSLDRSKALGMRIRLFALIKPEFSKQLHVLVDGQRLKHEFGLDGSLFVVSSAIPASDSSEETEVKIVLPSTYSPMELGTSHDGRKLGIAITDIRFGQPDGGFARLLKRLKLKR